MAAHNLDLRSGSRVPEAADVPEAPLVEQERPFRIRYTDTEGVSHVGDFVSRVLGTAERREAWRGAAGQAGVPWEQLPPEAQIHFWGVALVAKQVRDPRPAWFDRWAFEDPQLLLEVLAVCEEHTASFFRGRGAASEADAAKPRVAIEMLSAAGVPVPR